MSKNTEILNLSYLLDQEKEAILAVLKRDENLRKIEDKRVRKLKNELLEIKKKGAKIHRLRQNSAKICVRCQKPLGVIFNRGDICQTCQFRVCKACRVVGKDSAWKCTVCAKITQIRIATGDWFFEERSKRFRNATILGSEVVRKSIMRRFSVSATVGESTGKFSSDIKENTTVPAPVDSDSSGRRSDLKTSQYPGKGEDGRSIRSNYDTQSMRSTRSLPRANGLDRRFGKQTRSGEDAISVHSNFDAQSLRSISSIPHSERRSRPDIYSLPEASQAEFLHNGQESVDEISQASFKIDSRSESKRSSPISVRESAHSLDPTGNINLQTAIPSNSSRTSTSAIVHRSSPTPSATSNYSHTQSMGGAMKASSSIPEDIAKRHRRCGSGTPSLALSRVSIASDHSRSELDLSRPLAEGNEETGSIRSKSVPGGLNTNLECLNENEEDFAEHLGHQPASLRGGYSITSLNSMTSAYSEIWDYDNVKVTGEIILNLNYSYKTGALNVLVKSCKNLAVADEKKNKTDPYVKAYLLPDKSRQSKRKTKIKTNTTNPEFNEALKYVISHTQLETRTLQLSVWHNDRFGRNSFLGEVNIPLDTWNFENKEDECLALQPKMDSTSDVTLQYKGEIIIGLRYIPPEKNLTLPLESVTGKKSFKKSKKVPMPTGGILEVLVKEAKNLTAVKSRGTSDTFVKGYLLPDNNKSTKHKTPIIKKSVNPQWNHTFSFTSLQPVDLQNVSLELTVWDKESLSSNIFLGGVCLGCGTGISYGNEVTWMDAQGEEKYLWQKMMDHPGTLVEGTLMLRSTMARRKNTNQSS
ncbi:synaptotagmin-like protein 5 isoform X2 [Eleutherodactylus coqui]|uniref:synaptotagmin-like protein 5 isoform X2 n=1 Tax=Eleutherodactylus coqui TaxID=57060 RepID=UPI003461EB81